MAIAALPVAELFINKDGSPLPQFQECDATFCSNRWAEHCMPPPTSILEEGGESTKCPNHAQCQMKTLDVVLTTPPK